MLITVSSFLFMIPLGLSVASSTRVGNELGANAPESARRAAGVALLVALPLQLLQALSFFFARRVAGNLFSNDEAVVCAVAAILPVLCAATIGDALQAL